MKTLTFADALNPSSVAAGSGSGSGDANGDDIGDTLRPSWERFWQEARGEMPVAIAERIDDDSLSNVAENATAVPAVEQGNGSGIVGSYNGKSNSNKIENGTLTTVVARPSSSQYDDDPLTTVNVDSTTNYDEEQNSPKCEGCFYLEGIVGGALAFSVVLGVFFTELVGAVFYLCAVGFHKLVKLPAMPIFFQAIFQLITQAFMVVDAVCLFSSVLVSEILGFVTAVVVFAICIFTGDAHSRAYQWMMYIRKLAHLTRWTFRDFHHGWEPERKFPLGHGVDGDDNGSQNSNNNASFPNTHSTADNTATQKHGDTYDEPTVIETSATFVIETLDEDPETGIGSDEDELKNRKEMESKTSRNSTSSSQSSSSSASFLPPPPLQTEASSRTSVTETPVGVSSYVMPDDI